ncbi:MAG: sugar phosphate isomerase/epimerase [Candidatus Thorarchaeota archaeon]|nr:sugar phosphate isomerase/epimerase [Candidatus Thorarchaeota archaeon]
MEVGTFARDNKQIEFALKHNPDFIDLRMDLNYSIDFREAKRKLTDAGVACTLHLPSNPDWVPVDIAKDIFPYIDMGNEIGADLVTFHTPLSSLFYEDSMIETFLSALPELCDVVRENGVPIAIETLGLYFTELLLLFDRHPEIGLALDLGHGQIMATRNRALGHIQSFPNQIRMIIVHDNHGQKMCDDIQEIRKTRSVPCEEMRAIARKYDEHLPLGRGSIDFETMFWSLKQQGYDGKFLLLCEDQTRFPEEQEKFMELWLNA